MAAAKQKAELKVHALQQEVPANIVPALFTPASLETLLPGGVALEGPHLARMQALEAQWNEFLGSLPAPPAPAPPAPTAAQNDMDVDDVEAKVVDSIDSLLAAAGAASGPDVGAARSSAIKRIAEAQRQSMAKRNRIYAKAAPPNVDFTQSPG